MAFAGIGKRAVSVRQKAQRNKELKRELSRQMQLETLEGRQLMAVGPQLIGVQSSEGELLQAGSVLHVSPRELVFRFDDGSAIDGTTFSGIQLTRAGQDGIFDRAYVSSDLGTGGAVVLDFAAAVPGRSGNGIEIQFTKVTRTDSSMPRIQVTGQLINIEVNTAVGLKTTAQNLLDAINNDSAASALILATRLAVRSSLWWRYGSNHSSVDAQRSEFGSSLDQHECGCESAGGVRRADGGSCWARCSDRCDIER